ncbi:MAG: tRNA (N(6)-L-threonylcarbamoyladenosine(37)-C(2))-methylthiotransferase [Methanocellales archaeon]|nr:tRNA (N(6)-L-threonylcarbamoyladenosine(37)-C(2))-methylthiotransferase [Methanocellales archaeon]MDD3291053.1 tRNA (N(6)-L-threonylcarbamoyladenosine(37)-C(2))-methylthiotransferase [Methanocellales archaeon]MDD5234938.1 tRNA (N(6)-L-threonylcarbamoyladenosine(37)-C(2))-methylthiotransferase [Methanocellales archaeon]MDD5484692.1 tRNA (N(6)-L-threonylcarbamoyladenosine(37)-C(2))-methylthiotransferase [Methanocellales archaeon]
MKAYIETYGCTANKSDSQRIKTLLLQNNYEIADSIESSDIIVVNTCTVTDRTERRMIKRLRELKKEKTIVAGCLPAAQPDLVSGWKTITPRSIPSLASILGEQSPAKNEICPGDVTALVSISEGCVGHCSYCIVKQARGDLKSYPPKTIVNSVKGLVEAGAKEILITSQDTAAYGLDIGVGLPDLLNHITGIDGDFYIRVGMMNPLTTTKILDDLVDSFDDPKVFKFLHLPVQSGSDRILKSMNRGYSVSDYVKIVDTFRERFPGITLSTDFIVGYPGESAEDFGRTVLLLEETKPTKVNITRFSPRPNTPAASLPDTLERTKKERSRVLTKAHHKIAYELHRSLVGLLTEVIVTEKGKDGSVIARDSSYRNIVIQENLMLGEKHPVRIVGARTNYLIGELLRYT